MWRYARLVLCMAVISITSGANAKDRSAGSSPTLKELQAISERSQKQIRESIKALEARIAELSDDAIQSHIDAGNEAGMEAAKEAIGATPDAISSNPLVRAGAEKAAISAATNIATQRREYDAALHLATSSTELKKRSDQLREQRILLSKMTSLRAAIIQARKNLAAAAQAKKAAELHEKEQALSEMAAHVQEQERQNSSKNNGRDTDGPRGSAMEGVNGGRFDGPRSDGPKSDGPKSDGPKSDGPKSDGPKSDGPKSDGSDNDIGPLT